MKKLSKIKLAEISTIMSEEEMKTLKGGFDCGGGLNYYVGYCGNGVGFSVCSSDYHGFLDQSAGFCGAYNYN